jgi:glucose-1-phosphate cytidylyltransferase
MKVLILAGGFGTRFAEETNIKPKPMIEIGHKPILWHIMKIYSHYGFNDFIILCGYKSFKIKEFFLNYYKYNSNIEIDMKSNSVKCLDKTKEKWKITLLDTGEKTMTGGRIKKAQKFVGDESFLLTYGDGLSNVNIKKLINFHNSHNGIVTLTGALPGGRFGVIKLNKNKVKNFKNKSRGLIKSFKEKPENLDNYVNGGFFVCSNKVFNYIDKYSTVFENEPLQKLSKQKKLFLYKHNGFWHPMDNISDYKYLNKLWISNKAPWKIW